MLVGDRGMLTSARIEGLRAEGLGWISSLRAPAIRRLADAGTLQPGLFDERGLAEITSPEYPGERLVVCRNPLLADERARKREDLLAATSARLAAIIVRVEAGRLRGADRIGLAVGRVIDRFKVAEHFDLDIADDHLVVTRRQRRCHRGGGRARRHLRAAHLGRGRAAHGQGRGARLQAPESCRAGLPGPQWRSTCGSRPIHHHTSDRVRAHVFLCMLAYHVQWQLERAWAPLLFRDEERPELDDPVAPAERSDAALAKARTQRLPDGSPVHSFGTLLGELATLTRNRVVTTGAPRRGRLRHRGHPHPVTGPSPLSARAHALERVVRRRQSHRARPRSDHAGTSA